MQELLFVNESDKNKKSTEKVLLLCNVCQTNQGERKLASAKDSVRKRGYGFKCKSCVDASKAKARGVYNSQEFLSGLGVIDATPRVIKSHEKVEFRCHSCTNTLIRIIFPAYIVPDVFIRHKTTYWILDIARHHS